MCGIYACEAPPPSADLFLKGHIFVAGLVALWGRIVEHESGWRGEFAYPRALFCVTDMSRDEAHASDRQRTRCLTELDEFSVPVAIVGSYADLGAPDPVADSGITPAMGV